MKESKALECQNMIFCFSFVIQEKLSTTREDGRVGQHFNLIQVPLDVEVHKFGFSLDYQIAIHFEMGENE